MTTVGDSEALCMAPIVRQRSAVKVSSVSPLSPSRAGDAVTVPAIKTIAGRASGAEPRMPVIRESKRARSTLRSEFHQSTDDRRSTEFCVRSHSEYREAAGPPGAVDPSRRERSAIRGKIQKCAMREFSGVDRNRKIRALLVETFDDEVADPVQFENRTRAVDREL